MAYCINPNCHHRQNPDDAEKCQSCGTNLFIFDRIRLIEPLRPLTESPFVYTEIFEVDDRGDRRVLKLLRSNHPQLVEMFEREAWALQCIVHPNVPGSSAEDYFTVNLPNSSLKLHCLVMTKIAGATLDEWIKTHGRISQPQALKWLQELVEILDILHRTGFFHRDIKPSNIIVQPNGQLALIDFGGIREVSDTYLSKISGSGGTESGGGSQYAITSLCTPIYSPLEQINGRAVPQSDFYALGRTFVYCLTGTQLIDLPTDQKTEKLFWRNQAPQIDKPFTDLIEDLMAPIPVERPKTAEAILQRLERLPLKSKINRIINSNPFKISFLALGILGSISLYNLFTHALSGFYFYQASRNQDRPEIARADYETAIKYNPHDFYAYNNLAVVCQQLHDTPCVISTYNLILKAYPKMWEAHNGLGDFYGEQGKYDLAIAQYQKARDLNPHAIQPLSNLARLDNLKGDYVAAIKLVTEGLRLTQKPEFQAALYKNLGWSELEQAKLRLNQNTHQQPDTDLKKSFATARDHLAKAVKLDPNRTDAWCFLAQAQEPLGEDSSNSWQVCLIADANSSLPEVQRSRQQILQRLFKN